MSLEERVISPRVSKPKSPEIKKASPVKDNYTNPELRQANYLKVSSMKTRTQTREIAKKLYPKLDLDEALDEGAKFLVSQAIPALDWAAAKAFLGPTETSILPHLAARIGGAIGGGGGVPQAGLPMLNPTAHGITNPASLLAGMSFNFLTPWAMQYGMQPAPPGLTKGSGSSTFKDEILRRDIQNTPNTSGWR